MKADYKKWIETRLNEFKNMKLFNSLLCISFFVKRYDNNKVGITMIIKKLEQS